MRNRIRRWFLILFTGLLVFHQISYGLVSTASANTEYAAGFTDSKEKTKSIMEIQKEDTGASDASQDTSKERENAEENTQEGDTQDSSGEKENAQEEGDEEDAEQSSEEEKGTEKEDGQEVSGELSEKPTVEKENDGNRQQSNLSSEEKSESLPESNVSDTKRTFSAVPYANNSVNMPKATYKTMILQGAKGKGQRIGDSGKVALFSSNEAIQKDIDAKHKEYSSFTPHWNVDSTAVLSTQSGSKSVRIYLDDAEKGECAGVFGKPSNEPNIIGGRVYQLTAGMKNQLSCTYTNVGRYYDRNSGRSYAIDVKAVLVDYTAQSKETANVKKAIEAGAVGEKGGALFAFVGKVGVGVLTALCDSVTIRYQYYIHGTQTPVSLKGFARFEDIDAQQGIEFSPQADYFYAVNGANQYLGYSKGVYTAGNKAYIYALNSQAYSGGDEHAFFALFSGTELTLRYTFSKCSRTDDGGEKNNNQLEQYQVPFDASTVKPYSSSKSGGYMSFMARSASLPKPEISKTVFNGDNILSDVASPGKEINNILSDISDSFTYKVRSVCPYMDASEYHYASWTIQDRISPYLNVEKVKVYDGTGKENTGFDIQTNQQEDGSTFVIATAKNVANQSFYERNWYDLYVTVRVKEKSELEKYHLDFADLYAKDGEKEGNYVIKNKASLIADGSLVSGETETVIPQWIRVKKLNEEGEPVKGILFGIFTDSRADVTKEKALLTARTDEDGIASFKRKSFFDLADKDGPYYVKEISRGDFDHVYQMDYQWSYGFFSNKGNASVYGDIEETSGNILVNHFKILKEKTVIVRKKNKETRDYLNSAVFSLYQWSVNAGSYVNLGELISKKDQDGYYYTNEKAFTATEDNLGRFCVKETKAPYGCYNSGQTWTFETTDLYEEDQKQLEFFYKTQSGTTLSQKEELVYSNQLQKGKLIIHKTDEEHNVVSGAMFSVRAAEDIYAPWQCDEQGIPLEGEEPLASKGALCDMVTTDEGGEAISGPLFIGDYLVTEMKGAPDHVKSEQIYTVSFAYPQEDETKTVTKMLEVGNYIMRPALAVSKIADRTRNEQGEEVDFQKESGRYTEQKIPGQYNAGERIRYKITVTNTGNVDLYHIRLLENMAVSNKAGQKLEDYIEKERSFFLVPDNLTYESTLGDSISCVVIGEEDSCLLLDKLSVGDSVSVYYETVVAEGAANIYDLKNKVSVTASYDNHQDDSNVKRIPVNTDRLVDDQGNKLTEDEDTVHIPGNPEQTVVKMADRTTGCTISNGSLNGTKVPGVYEAGDKVIFTIVVKNNGTANLKNIVVEDILSEELKKISIEEKSGFRWNSSEGYLTTEKGERLDARLLDSNHIIICETSDPVSGEGTLKSGDEVTLYYEILLKEDIANLYDLENKVVVNSFYYNGQEDEEVLPAEDVDVIEVPGVPEAKLAKISDHTTGAVLVEGRYQQEKITGSYKNGEIVTYMITVTNSGTADLYNLKVTDVMEERLVSAFVKDSIGFQYGLYHTRKGETVPGKKEETDYSKANTYTIELEHLKAGDSVELYLSGKVNQTAGEFTKLENKAYVTAHYKKGNEESQQIYEEMVEQSEFNYLLFYHANNGTTEKTTDSETPIRRNHKITLNGNPFYKDGYTFLGWNTKADGSGEYYASGAAFTMPAQDVHLYAQWTPNGGILKKQYKYSLIYHSNNKKEEEHPDSETRCLAGTVVTLDENMFRNDGYRFLGWSTTPENQNLLWKPGQAYQMPKKDVHLYAQWEKEEKVVLTYHSNNQKENGEGSGIEERTKKDFRTPCYKNTEITVLQCEFEKTDYIFDGWSIDPDAETGEMKPDEKILLKKDTDLYAIWKPEEDGEQKLTYDLTYHGNNESLDVYCDSETPAAKEKEIKLDKNLFHYAGHEFLGWNTKADGTGDFWEEEQIYTMPQRNVHLYAQWKQQKKYSLVYHSNYPEKTGKVNQDQRMDLETPCSSGTKITLDGTLFQCDGYAFLGWSLDPCNQDESAVILLPEETYTLSEDTTLYAVWTDQLEEYGLVYSSNTETPDWETDPNSPSPAGTPRKLMNNPFANKSAVFCGWSPNPDTKPDSDEILLPGTYYEQPERNVVLYAIWKEEETVSLYYDGNGGYLPEKQSDSEIQQDNTQEEEISETSGNRIQDEETPSVRNDKILINRNPFIRKGYQFVGWSFQVSDDNPQNRLYPGCEYELPEQDTVLYAVWEKVPSNAFDDSDNKLSQSKYTPIAVTDLMKDEDYIHIPGIPKLHIAKLADRTHGVTLKNGRYKGKRIAGTYYKGETVTYKITVTNDGTASASNLKIQEKPSKLWEDAMKIIGFTCEEGDTLQTDLGKTICIINKTKNQIILDHLDAGDRVIVYYKSIVKTESIKQETLKNKITLSANQKDGTPVTKTKDMTDTDNIKLADKKQGINLTRISPKTGDPTSTYALLILGSGMFLAAIIIFLFQKRRTENS